MHVAKAFAMTLSTSYQIFEAIMTCVPALVMIYRQPLDGGFLTAAQTTPCFRITVIVRAQLM